MFYKKLFKTVVGKILLLGMAALSIAFGIVFVLKCESMLLALLWWIFTTVLIFLLFSLVMVVIILVVDSRNSELSHELKEQVKVIDKRQEDINVDEEVTFYNYITFEFSDGSSEELFVGSGRKKGIWKKRICTKGFFYNIAVNDTGILTYKLLTFHPRKILSVYVEGSAERRFIAFEKDK